MTIVPSVGASYLPRRRPLARRRSGIPPVKGDLPPLWKDGCIQRPGSCCRSTADHLPRMVGMEEHVSSDLSSYMAYKVHSSGGVLISLIEKRWKRTT